MTNDPTRTRRRYSLELNAKIIAECDAPGASMTKVTMSHGIQRQHRPRVAQGSPRELCGASSRTPEFVPELLAPMAPPPAADCNVEIELRRVAVFMKITWPACAAADLAAWTCELLR